MHVQGVKPILPGRCQAIDQAGSGVLPLEHHADLIFDIGARVILSFSCARKKLERMFSAFPRKRTPGSPPGSGANSGIDIAWHLTGRLAPEAVLR